MPPLATQSRPPAAPPAPPPKPPPPPPAPALRSSPLSAPPPPPPPEAPPRPSRSRAVAGIWIPFWPLGHLPPPQAPPDAGKPAPGYRVPDAPAGMTRPVDP